MKKWNIRAWLVMGLVMTGVAWSGCDRKSTTSEPTASSGQKASLPRLLDLGAESCIPCKMMKPILAELKTEFQGKMQVDFIDVWKTPEEGKTYGIQSIPTQIFFDASGKELFRHEGFFSKADILAKWKEFGVTF